MRDPIITSRQIQHPSPDIQEQGLALMRNYICDGHEVEITHLLEGMGEEELFSSLLSPKLYPDAEIEPMEQVGMRISFEVDWFADHGFSRRCMLFPISRLAMTHTEKLSSVGVRYCKR